MSNKTTFSEAEKAETLLTILQNSFDALQRIIFEFMRGKTSLDDEETKAIIKGVESMSEITFYLEIFGNDE